LHRALRQPAERAFVRRLLLGALAALTLSACQTPFGANALRERASSAPAAVASVPAPTARVTPPAVEMPTKPDPEYARPTLVERLGELLVVHAPDLSPLDRSRVAHAIESAQEAHQVDPLLILAIMQQESGFDPHAHGRRGSIGLMQIRPFVARDVAQRHGIPWAGPRTLLDPAANVAIGACYLGEMLDMYPDAALAIAAYNLGPYRVQKFLARGHSPRPKYLLSVLARYQMFTSQFGPLAPESIEEADAD
jgi:soluble lytic murein transglycosylase-like protein